MNQEEKLNEQSFNLRGVVFKERNTLNILLINLIDVILINFGLRNIETIFGMKVEL